MGAPSAATWTGHSVTLLLPVHLVDHSSTAPLVMFQWSQIDVDGSISDERTKLRFDSLQSASFLPVKCCYAFQLSYRTLFRSSISGVLHSCLQMKPTMKLPLLQALCFLASLSELQ